MNTSASRRLRLTQMFRAPPEGSGGFSPLPSTAHTACLLGSGWLHSPSLLSLVIIPWYRQLRNAGVFAATDQYFHQYLSLTSRQGLWFTTQCPQGRDSAVLFCPPNQHHLDGAYTTKCSCQHEMQLQAPWNTASVC